MAKKIKIIKAKVGDADVDVAEMRDGKVVCIDDSNGTEFVVDPSGSTDVIARLNREAQTNREAKETVETQLKAFEGIDPEKAREALATVENLESGELLQAGKVEEIKAQVRTQVEGNYKGQLTAAQAQAQKDKETITSLTGTLSNEKITNAFSNSKYIQEKLAVSPAVARAVFGNSFKVEGDKLVAYDANGTKLWSNASGAEPNFDEALEIIVGTYPDRDSLLKGKGNSGGGGEGGQGGGGGGGANDKSISRKAFEALGPEARMVHIRKGGVVADE